MRYLQIQLILTIIVISLFSSCSQKRMATMMATTPDLVYDKSQAKGFNNYQKDALYLTETIRQAYPRLNEKIPEHIFRKEKELLLNDLARMDNDLDFEIRLQRFVALLRDAHSKVVVDYPMPETGGYPLSLFMEKEKWIIVNIDRAAADSSVIGSEIISVNQIPVKEIEARAAKLESSENIYRTKLIFPPNLRFPSYWKALGVSETNGHGNELHFVITIEGVEKSFTLYPNAKPKGYPIKPKNTPFTNQQNNGFYYITDKEDNYAYLQMNTSLDYVSIKSEIASYTNFFVRPFALSYLKKQKKDAMNFGLVLQSLFKEINEKGIDNLIIDLRYNSGGDERTGKQLLWYLDGTEDIKGFTTYVNVSDYFRQTVKLDYKKYNKDYRKKYGTKIPDKEINLNEEIYGYNYFDNIIEEDSPYLLDASIPKFKGKVYVLQGNVTFSAAQMLATTIADNQLGVMVGQPTGNKPTCQTGSSLFKLPHTKKIVNLSYVYMERPDRSKNSQDALFPDIKIDVTFQDLIDGNDPGFEYIMKEIKQND